MKNLLNVYWAVMAITTVFAVVFRNDKKKFIISTAIVHILVCGLRYDQMHGDLSAYKRGFYSLASAGWFSDVVIKNGRNTLFYLLNKLVATLTNSNFQVLLFVISFISIAAISYVIYRYSEQPYISFLMWSCFGFYIFSFYSIKQTLAMAFIMLSSIGIFERKPVLFYVLVIIAGFVHMPAFVFLPAYELCRVKKPSTIIRFYLIFIVTVILFKNQIVDLMADLYYEGGMYTSLDTMDIGGKFIMMICLLGVGVVLCNLRNEYYRYTFILLATASLLQMFSAYNHVFTRLADYYFQFIILYAPFMLKQVHNDENDISMFYFNDDSRKLLTIGFVLLALAFYYRVYFRAANSVVVDDLVANFRFYWQ